MATFKCRDCGVRFDNDAQLNKHYTKYCPYRPLQPSMKVRPKSITHTERHVPPATTPKTSSQPSSESEGVQALKDAEATALRNVITLPSIGATGATTTARPWSTNKSLTRQQQNDAQDSRLHQHKLAELARLVDGHKAVQSDADSNVAASSSDQSVSVAMKRLLDERQRVEQKLLDLGRPNSPRNVDLYDNDRLHLASTKNIDLGQTDGGDFGDSVIRKMRRDYLARGGKDPTTMYRFDELEAAESESQYQRLFPTSPARRYPRNDGGLYNARGHTFHATEALYDDMHLKRDTKSRTFDGRYDRHRNDPWDSWTALPNRQSYDRQYDPSVGFVVHFDSCSGCFENGNALLVCVYVCENGRVVAGPREYEGRQKISVGGAKVGTATTDRSVGVVLFTELGIYKVRDCPYWPSIYLHFEIFKSLNGSNGPWSQVGAASFHPLDPNKLLRTGGWRLQLHYESATQGPTNNEVYELDIRIADPRSQDSSIVTTDYYGTHRPDPYAAYGGSNRPLTLMNRRFGKILKEDFSPSPEKLTEQTAEVSEEEEVPDVTVNGNKKVTMSNVAASVHAVQSWRGAKTSLGKINHQSKGHKARFADVAGTAVAAQRGAQGWNGIAARGVSVEPIPTGSFEKHDPISPRSLSSPPPNSPDKQSRFSPLSVSETINSRRNALRQNEGPPNPDPSPTPNSNQKRLPIKFLVHIASLHYEMGPKQIVVGVKHPSAAYQGMKWKTVAAQKSNHDESEYLVNDCGLISGVHLQSDTKLVLTIETPPNNESGQNTLLAATSIEIAGERIAGSDQIALKTGLRNLSIYNLSSKSSRPVGILTMSVVAHNESEDLIEFCPAKAWVAARPSPKSKLVYKHSHGIDLYIDSARFLPPDVTITRIIGGVYNSKFKLQGLKIIYTSLPDEPDALNPDFNLRAEIRNEKFDPASRLVIWLITINRTTKTVECIGHCALKLFNMHDGDVDMSQKSNSNARGEKVVLNEGAHQLRIQNSIPRTLSESLIGTADEGTSLAIPCASLLVRIVRPTLGRKGKPLSTADVPQDEWMSKGIVAEKPAYKDRVYYCPDYNPSIAESTLFTAMLNRTAMSVRDCLRKLVDKYHPETHDTEILRMLDSAQPPKLKCPLLNLDRLVKYDKDFGVAIAIDEAANIPQSVGPCFPTVTLVTEEDSLLHHKSAVFRGCSYKLDWENVFGHHGQSTSRHPVWRDGFHILWGAEFPECTFAVVALWSVQARRSSSKRRDSVGVCRLVGWTLVPAMLSGGFCNYGLFQVPLFKNKLDYERLRSLAAERLEQHDLARQISIGRLFKLHDGGASVTVRITDPRRQLNRSATVNKSFMPSKKKFHEPAESHESMVRMIPMGMGRDSYEEFARKVMIQVRDRDPSLDEVTPL